MSFLSEVTLRRASALRAPRLMPVPVAATRSFSTTLAQRKTATESVKDGVSKGHRVVSDKVVDGIDAAAAGAEKAKEMARNVTGSEAAQKAKEVKGDAMGKAQEMKGEAAGKAEELKGKAKGAAEEAKSKM